MLWVMRCEKAFDVRKRKAHVDKVKPVQQLKSTVQFQHTQIIAKWLSLNQKHT